MYLSTESVLVILFVGIIAGWLAGKVVRGTGFGLIGDLLVGIAGALVATFLFPARHQPRHRPGLGDHLFGAGRDHPVADRAPDSRRRANLTHVPAI